MQEILGIIEDPVVGPLNRKLASSHAMGSEIMIRISEQLNQNGRIQARDMNIPIEINFFPDEVFGSTPPADTEAVTGALGTSPTFPSRKPANPNKPVPRTKPLTPFEKRQGADPKFLRKPVAGDAALKAVESGLESFGAAVGRAVKGTVKAVGDAVTVPGSTKRSGGGLQARASRIKAERRRRLDALKRNGK